MCFFLLVAVFGFHPIQATNHRAADGKEKLYGGVRHKTVDFLSGKVRKFRDGHHRLANVAAHGSWYPKCCNGQCSSKHVSNPSKSL